MKVSLKNARNTLNLSYLVKKNYPDVKLKSKQLHGSIYLRKDYLSLKYRGVNLIIQNTKGDEYDIKRDVSSSKVVTVVVFIVAIFVLAALLYPQTFAFPNILVIIGAVIFVTMLYIVYQKRVVRSFCKELQAILKEREEWERKERERIEKERIESEKASMARAEREKTERKKANKTSFERQIASLKDEEWCFRPNYLNESKSSYEKSGDPNSNDDHEDYYDCHYVTGAYERRAFFAVIIPEGTKSIPEKAFADCENLLYVYVPDSVTLIEGGAFSRCYNLFEVSLPKGIHIINDCHEWRRSYTWDPYEDRYHDDDYYSKTFEDMSCLVYRERPLSAEEWLAEIKKGK